jgi:CCR4-NOT transcriptional regulation complex NOT5 subunit
MALAFMDQRSNNKKKEEPKQEEVNQGQQQPRAIINSNFKPAAMTLTVQQHQL